MHEGHLTVGSQSVELRGEADLVLQPGLDDIRVVALGFDGPGEVSPNAPSRTVVDDHRWRSVECESVLGERGDRAFQGPQTGFGGHRMASDHERVAQKRVTLLHRTRDPVLNL